MVERPKPVSLLVIFYGSHVLLFVSIFIFLFSSFLHRPSGPPGPGPADILIFFIYIISLVGALLNLSVACGLFLAKGWARVLGIAISVLGLPFLALGGLSLGVNFITDFFLAGLLGSLTYLMDVSVIILNIAAIYYLTRPEVKSYFAQAGKASISIVLDKYNFSFGEELTGVVRVKARDEFDADEIRVSALCVASTQKPGTSISWSSEGITVEKTKGDRMEIPWRERVTVSKALHLTQGYEEEFPFSLMLPESYPRTYGRVYKTGWSVKGVIAVRRRPDINGETININVIDRTRSHS